LFYPSETTQELMAPYLPAFAGAYVVGVQVYARSALQTSAAGRGFRAYCALTEGTATREAPTVSRLAVGVVVGVCAGVCVCVRVCACIRVCACGCVHA
jgi:hypothetical protein